MSYLPSIVLFAVDFSGSTNGQAEYWPRVEEQFLKAFFEFGNDVRCMLWDSKIVLVSHAEMRARIASKQGRGGTNPTPIAQYISDGIGRDFTLRKLIVITDGRISPIKVKTCDAVLAPIRAGGHLPAVDACIFSRANVDLSVVAPFTRSAEFTIQQNDEVLAKGDTRVDLNESGLLDAIETPADFLAQFERLYSIIVVQNLGRSNTQLRDRLLVLKKRLLKWFALDNQRRVAADDTPTVASALEEGDFGGAVAAARSLVQGVAAESGKLQQEVSEKALQLVDACVMTSFSIGVLNTRRAQRAEQLEDLHASEMVPEEEEEGASGESSFECPIMLDAAAPVLLINANGPPLLTGVEPAIVDDLTDCPLNLLKYPTLISHVVARIDHAIGAEAFEGLYKAVPHNYGALNVTSPYTRAPVLGCIPFGSVAQHVRLGSWVARKLMTGGRVLGNPHLWLAAIYFVVRDHMPRLAEHGALMDAFRTHLAHRLTAYETNIALSGLATYPLVNVPVGVALWYVVAGSTALFAMDAEQFEQERLRQFWSVARYMRALVEDVIGWPVMDAAAPRVAGLDAVERRAITLRVFSALMARKQDMSLLRQDLRRLYQNHLILSRLRKGGKRPVSDEDATVVVMTDGPCAPELAAASPFAWMRDLLPLPTILRLGTLVAPNAKVGSVLLDDAAIFSDCRAKVAAVTHYGYDYARSSADDLGDPKVCPATMRLWTYDARDHPKSPELWSDRASRVLGAPVDRFLSAYNYFIEYVANHRAYPPTQADFIAHMAAREAARTSRPARDTLPENVEIMARIVVANYKAAFAARGGGIPTPTEFTKLMEGSRTKSQRRAIETAWVREVGNQAACAIVVKGVTALSSGSSSVPSSDQVVGT